MTTPWAYRYALRTEDMSSSIIRELLKWTQQPEVISFAGGVPAPELFPVAEFEEAACRILKKHGATALQYSTTEGYLPLRQLIVEQMSRYGIHAREDNVLITSGSQQGLDLLDEAWPQRAAQVWQSTYRLHWGQHLVDAERHLYALKVRNQLALS